MWLLLEILLGFEYKSISVLTFENEKGKILHEYNIILEYVILFFWSSKLNNIFIEF